MSCLGLSDLDAGRNRLRTGLERAGMLWLVENLGILRSAQDDGRNVQQQELRPRRCGEPSVRSPTHRKVRDGWGTRRLVIVEGEQTKASNSKTEKVLQQSNFLCACSRVRGAIACVPCRRHNR